MNISWEGPVYVIELLVNIGSWNVWNGWNVVGNVVLVAVGGLVSCAGMCYQWHSSFQGCSHVDRWTSITGVTEITTFYQL